MSMRWHKTPMGYSYHFIPEGKDRALCGALFGDDKGEGVKSPSRNRCLTCKAKFPKWYSKNSITGHTSLGGSKQKAGYVSSNLQAAIENSGANVNVRTLKGRLKAGMVPCATDGCIGNFAEWRKIRYNQSYCYNCFKSGKGREEIEKRKAKKKADDAEMMNAILGIASRKAAMKRR